MQNGIVFPDKIFFTGVPGSRWSGIAQTLENMSVFNITDRNLTREYKHNNYSGHVGAYFGNEMELLPILDDSYISSAWSDHKGTKLVKSHDWAYNLQEVKDKFPDDWIMLVYRPDMASYAWWCEAGGFNIKYPNYSWYKNTSTMLGEIVKQNNKILEFAYNYNLTWNYFTSEWIYKNFNQYMEINKKWSDVLVTLLK